MAEDPWFDENGFEKGDTVPDLTKHERGDPALGRFLDDVGKVKTLLEEGVKETIPEKIQALAEKTLEKLLPLAQKVMERAIEGAEVYGNAVQQYGGNTPPGSPRSRNKALFQVDGVKGREEIGLRIGQLFDFAASTLNLTPDQLNNAVFVFTLSTGGIKDIGKKLFTQGVTKTTTKQVVKNVPKNAVQEVKNKQYKDILAKADRKGTALKSDPYHRGATFGSQTKGDFHKFDIIGDDGKKYELLQKYGKLNEKEGVFEYLLNKDGQITHQRFIQGGKIIGSVNQ